MEYRTLSMDYCILTTGRDLQKNKTEYTVQVPATMFTSEFMFTIWINDEDKSKGKMYEIIRNKIKELMSSEYNTVRNLRKELEDTKENADTIKNRLLEEIETAADDYYELRERFLEQQNNTEYYRQKYLEKVNECEDLKAELQVSRNNTEYFKNHLEERNDCIKEYVLKELRAQAFEEQQSQAIEALRNQILEMKKSDASFRYIKNVLLKECDTEINYVMGVIHLTSGYLYHFIIEDDKVSYVPQIFFYQSKRDDDAAIEYAQNLLNNETTLYKKLRIQDEIIAKHKKRISSLEKIVAEYREKAQGNY